MNTEILVDKDLESRMNEPVDVKFSVWGTCNFFRSFALQLLLSHSPSS
jgi:hypothetical protein